MKGSSLRQARIIQKQQSVIKFFQFPFIQTMRIKKFMMIGAEKDHIILSRFTLICICHHMAEFNISLKATNSTRWSIMHIISKPKSCVFIASRFIGLFSSLPITFGRTINPFPTCKRQFKNRLAECTGMFHHSQGTAYNQAFSSPFLIASHRTMFFLVSFSSFTCQQGQEFLATIFANSNLCFAPATCHISILPYFLCYCQDFDSMGEPVPPELKGHLPRRTRIGG